MRSVRYRLHAQTLARRRISTVRAVVIVMLLLVGGMSGRMAAGQSAPGPGATPGEDQICATGRLRVGNVPDLQKAWEISIQADSEGAKQWQGDAELIAVDITCGFLTDEARIRTLFYSAKARGTWDPETNRIQPLDPGDPDPKALDPSRVSFVRVHQALIDLGVGADDDVGASGMTIRVNSADDPFGPQGIPVDAIVVHLTIGDDAATSDVYIDAETGRAYSFDASGDVASRER